MTADPNTPREALTNVAANIDFARRLVQQAKSFLRTTRM
jgi:hypothetical protein